MNDAPPIPGATPFREEDLPKIEQMMRVAHGLEDFTEESVLELLRLEATAAALDRRDRIFIGTSGPWLRIVAPTERPPLTELAAELLMAGVIVHPVGPFRVRQLDA